MTGNVLGMAHEASSYMRTVSRNEGGTTVDSTPLDKRTRRTTTRGKARAAMTAAVAADRQAQREGETKRQRE